MRLLSLGIYLCLLCLCALQCDASSPSRNRLLRSFDDDDSGKGLQVFITGRMRRVLEEELGYLREEVNIMEPQIAAVVIERGLARPSNGMPISWRKEAGSKKGTKKGKRRGNFLTRIMAGLTSTMTRLISKTASLALLAATVPFIIHFIQSEGGFTTQNIQESLDKTKESAKTLGGVLGVGIGEISNKVGEAKYAIDELVKKNKADEGIAQILMSKPKRSGSSESPSSSETVVGSPDNMNGKKSSKKTSSKSRGNPFARVNIKLPFSKGYIGKKGTYPRLVSTKTGRTSDIEPINIKLDEQAIINSIEEEDDESWRSGPIEERLAHLNMKPAELIPLAADNKGGKKSKKFDNANVDFDALEEILNVTVWDRLWLAWDVFKMKFTSNKKKNMNTKNWDF